MTLSRIKNVGFNLLLLSTLLAFGCHKKVAATPPPPPPPAAPVPAVPVPAPTITLRAQPTAIDRGGALTLTWESRNAATVSLTPGIGDVPPNGNRSVSPTSSVTYTASAIGPGGTATDIARITVNVPPAPPTELTPRPRGPDVTTEQLFTQNVKDVHFDYDKADIKADEMSILQMNTSWLKANANVRFTIEGHCDDRGSEEYNIGLGDRRANAVKEYLISQGVQASRINIVSYGEERPMCRDESETCFSMNRRAHFLLTQ